MRKASDRGIPFSTFNDRLDGWQLVVSIHELATLDFGTLPIFVRVFADFFPGEDLYVLLVRSRSNVKVTIRSSSDVDENPLTLAYQSIRRIALWEAARLLENEASGYRTYPTVPAISMWTSRYQRGDAILRFIDTEFNRLLQRTMLILDATTATLRELHLADATRR